MTEEKPLTGEIEDTAGTSRVNLDAEVSENAPRLHGRVLTFATGEAFQIEIDPNMELENVMALLEAEVSAY